MEREYYSECTEDRCSHAPEDWSRNHYTPYAYSNDYQRRRKEYLRQIGR